MAVPHLPIAAPRLPVALPRPPVAPPQPAISVAVGSRSPPEPVFLSALPTLDEEEAPPLAASAPVLGDPAEPIAPRNVPTPEDVVGRPAPENGPEPVDDDIRPLSAIRTNLKPPSGEMPADYARQQFGNEPQIVGGSLADRRPVDMVYFWDATAR